MWFGTALLTLWFFLVPTTLLAQSPGCRDPYTDNSIGGEQRAKLLLENGAACVLGIADFDQVIRLKPDATEAWYNRVTALVAAHKYDHGIADLSEAIRLQPDLARAYCNRGLAHERQHDYDSAIADANAGIEKDANLALCHFVRGDAYVEKGEYQKAVKELSVGLDLKPGNPELSASAVKRMSTSASATRLLQTLGLPWR